MSRRRTALGLSVATGLLLAGCGGSADYTADDDLMNQDASASAPTSSVDTSSAPTPVASEPVGDLDRLAAAKTAKKTLLAWARPTLTYEQWWVALKPMLTAEAQESYAYTDPANVPALGITSKAKEDRAPVDPYVTTFYFQTTKGRFGVDVARPPDGGAWRAVSIIFPGSESQRQ